MSEYNPPTTVNNSSHNNGSIRGRGFSRPLSSTTSNSTTSDSTTHNEERRSSINEYNESTAIRNVNHNNRNGRGRRSSRQFPPTNPNSTTENT